MSLKKTDIVFEARVTARSSRNKIVIEGTVVRIYIHTVPEDGKANRECIKLLSDFFSVPKKDVSIVKGEKSRNKTFCIKNAPSDSSSFITDK